MGFKATIRRLIMLDIVKQILNWLTLGPLKGHRTKIIGLVLFVLAGLKATGHLPMDEQTYLALIAILTGVGVQTAAVHK